MGEFLLTVLSIASLFAVKGYPWRGGRSNYEDS